MQYPMYTVPAGDLLEMTRIEAHEELMARGDLVIFDGVGNAGFVSHQWVSKEHPDPELRQMQVLQATLRRLLLENGFVSVEAVTEAIVPSTKGIFFQEFQSLPLFLWYDYFSVPQRDASKQEKAIHSIPAYVAKCRFFFALCPTIDCPGEGKVLSLGSWARRGWCRLERASRELSENDSWIKIQSPAALQIVSTAYSFLVTGSVGEGDFTVESDRALLAPVMRAIVKRKLMLSLQAGDLPAFRRHLSLQTVHLRGLGLEPISVLPPRADAVSQDGKVEDFLHQNGLTHVSQRDSAGWWPLHYAAMSGKLTLIEALLQERADPNRRTAKDEPKLGFPPWVSALDLAVSFKHNEVARALIMAQAKLEGGIQPSTIYAAAADNAEGIRLLCTARGDPRARNLFGQRPLECAATLGCRVALEELVRSTSPSGWELSLALQTAVLNLGGSAEIVEFLVNLRADVDFQYDPSRDLSRFGRLFSWAKSLQHTWGKPTQLTALTYQCYGRTSLMGALQAAQHEAAAALISFGARVDIKNLRGWTAMDFAKDVSIPQWLQQGLEGDTAECDRVTALTLPTPRPSSESWKAFAGVHPQTV